MAKREKPQGSPVARQYAAIKAQYPGVLLCFRVGRDCHFLEDDAAVVAGVEGADTGTTDLLGLGLVKVYTVARADAEPVIARLIAAGHRVGMCEPVGGG